MKDKKNKNKKQHKNNIEIREVVQEKSKLFYIKKWEEFQNWLHT